MTELLELGLIETVDKDKKSTGSSGESQFGIVEERLFELSQFRISYTNYQVLELLCVTPVVKEFMHLSLPSVFHFHL